MMKEVELGNVCHFENGDRGKNYPSQSAFVEIGIPFISAKDLENNLIKHDNLNYISEETYNKLGSGKLQPNDILFCLRGSLGKFAINKDGLKGGIASSLVLLRAKEDLQINYLKHYLNSPRMKRLITKSDNGSSQPNLSGANVKKFKIPLPPLDQQKKIAAILDAADAYRQKTKALIEKYDELTQSLFLDMFGDPVSNPKGWKVSSLGDICDVRDGTHDSPKYVNDGYALVTSKNIKKGKLVLDDINYVSKDDYDKINKRSRVNKGDILMPMIGTIGNPLIVDMEVNFAIKNVALIKKSVKQIVNTEIIYFLLAGHYLQWYSSKNNKGGTQKFLSLGDIRKMPIIIPNDKLQNQFAERVQAIEAQKAQAQASLAQAEDLFNSLLQRAFKGELTS